MTTEKKNPLIETVLGYLKRNLGIMIGLFILCIIATFSTNKFLTGSNLLNLLKSNSVNAIICCGMLMAILLGQIDISVGSMVGLSGGVSIRIRNDAYTAIGTTTLGGVSVIVFYAAIALLVTWVLLNKTRFGYYIYAIGGNRVAAKYSGVNEKLYNMIPYIYIGMLCGIGGLIWSARLGSAAATLGTGFEMDAISAVVIGGTSMSGGLGTVGGTFVGILIIGVLNNGLNLMGINSFWQDVFKGVIILVAVIIDVLRKSKSNSN